jgi:hypothetical protein
LTRIDRELAERKARGQRENEVELQKLMDETFAAIDQDVMRDLGVTSFSSSRDSARPKAVAPTTMSKAAASALSRNSKTAFVASTKSSSTRAPLALDVRKSRPPPASHTARQPTQFPVSTTASRSTLGYSQGRAVSQKVRKPSAMVFRDAVGAAAAGKPDTTRKPTGRSVSEEQFQAKVRDVVTELRSHSLKNEDDGLFGNSIALEDDEYADFQLALP